MKSISMKLFSFSLILLLTSSCNTALDPWKNSNSNKVRTVETLSYDADPEKEIVNFNATDGSTVVMMGKYLPENKSYTFIYQLKNGVWIGSNTNFRIGDTLSLDQMCLIVDEVPTVKGNPREIKSKNISK